MASTSCRLTVLCENSVAGSRDLIGEHGWAVHADVDDRSILFDTGQGLGITNNSRILGIDLARLDAVVLSHGHYDHTSGLPDVLKRCGPVDIHCHEDCFLDRYWIDDQECREIGIRFKRRYLESLGARFCFVKTFTRIADDIYLSGEIPRLTPFEQVDPHMKTPSRAGGLVPDRLLDDQSLVIDTEKGLVIILGCAHSGVINILTHVTTQLPGRPIHTVIGGTHLGYGEPGQFEKTVAALEPFAVHHLGAGHCTGLEYGARLQQLLGKRYFFSAVGICHSC